MRQNDWLVAQSFEQVSAVLSAINTLSIHTKLTLVGVDDTARIADVGTARRELLQFLERLEGVIQNAEHRRDGVTLGVDPRLGRLARKFLSLRAKWPSGSSLSSASLPRFRELLAARDPQESEALVIFLGDLRSLLEEHIHSDIAGILGDV